MPPDSARHPPLEEARQSGMQAAASEERQQGARVLTEKVYRYAGFRAHYLIPMQMQDDIVSHGQAQYEKTSRGREQNEIQVQAERAVGDVKESYNVLTCDVLREVEDTFSIVVQFYQIKEQTEYSLLTYETEKEDWEKLKEQCAGGEIRLRIPEDALIWMES